MASPSTCHPCGEEIIWARTTAGASLPFDRERDVPSAWVLIKDVRGDWQARPLAPGEQPRPAEHRHAMHFDTCTERAHVGNG